MHSQGHVVLLHAFPLNATLWQPQVAAAPDGWRLVARDLPGFGTSTAPAAVSMDGMARSVLRLLDAVGIQQAVIGGVSMGGYLTLALYRLAPERFSGMILADTRATADTEAQVEGRRTMQALVREKGPSAIADEMLPKLLGKTTQRERPELLDQVRTMIEGNTAAAISGALEAMVGRPDSTDLLPSISVPTLVVCGEEDVLTPPPDSKALHEGIPGSRLVMIPGAGHLSNLEAPEPFTGALSGFLESVTTAGSRA